MKKSSSDNVCIGICTDKFNKKGYLGCSDQGWSYYADGGYKYFSGIEHKYFHSFKNGNFKKYYSPQLN